MSVRGRSSILTTVTCSRSTTRHALEALNQPASRLRLCRNVDVACWGRETHFGSLAFSILRTEASRLTKRWNMALPMPRQSRVGCDGFVNGTPATPDGSGGGGNIDGGPNHGTTSRKRMLHQMDPCGKRTGVESAIAPDRSADPRWRSQDDHRRQACRTRSRPGRGTPIIGVNLARTLLSPKSPSKRSSGRRLGCRPRTAGGYRGRQEADSRHYVKQSSAPPDWTTWRTGRLCIGRSAGSRCRPVGVCTSSPASSLPEFIGICTGQGFKGNHRCPDPLVPRFGLRWSPGAFVPGRPHPVAWPELRDVVHMALGVAGFLVIRFLLNLIIRLA